jgi:hypothetical protein
VGGQYSPRHRVPRSPRGLESVRGKR